MIIFSALRRRCDPQTVSAAPACNCLSTHTSMPITPGFPRRLRLEWIAANLRQDFFERHPYEAMRRRLLDELGVSWEPLLAVLVTERSHVIGVYQLEDKTTLTQPSAPRSQTPRLRDRWVYIMQQNVHNQASFTTTPPQDNSVVWQKKRMRKRKDQKLTHVGLRWNEKKIN